MDELTKRYERLVSEIAYLRKENDALKHNQMQHCRGCRFAKVHTCRAFCVCEAHGSIINLDEDGCSWRKEK